MSKRTRGFQTDRTAVALRLPRNGCQRGRSGGPHRLAADSEARESQRLLTPRPTNHGGPRPAVAGSDPPVAIPTRDNRLLRETRENNCCRAGMCLALHTSNRTALRRASLKPNELPDGCRRHTLLQPGSLSERSARERIGPNLPAERDRRGGRWLDRQYRARCAE